MVISLLGTAALFTLHPSPGPTQGPVWCSEWGSSAECPPGAVLNDTLFQLPQVHPVKGQRNERDNKLKKQHSCIACTNINSCTLKYPRFSAPISTLYNWGIRTGACCLWVDKPHRPGGVYPPVLGGLGIRGKRAWGFLWIFKRYVW